MSINSYRIEGAINRGVLTISWVIFKTLVFLAKERPSERWSPTSEYSKVDFNWDRNVTGQLLSVTINITFLLPKRLDKGRSGEVEGTFRSRGPPVICAKNHTYVMETNRHSVNVNKGEGRGKDAPHSSQTAEGSWRREGEGPDTRGVEDKQNRNRKRNKTYAFMNVPTLTHVPPKWFVASTRATFLP